MIRIKLLHIDLSKKNNFIKTYINQPFSLNYIFVLSKIVIYLALIIGWLIIVFNLGKNNLPNENVWYDESGQFWMAKGLNHFSPPLSEERSLIDVIKENSIYNLDPGGFTIILHFWTKISNSITWVRIVPYTFFILSIIFLGLIVYQFSKSIGLSLLSLFYLPIIKDDIFYYAFEVRAFSMEYAGVVISILLFLIWLKRKTYKNLLILNIILALFSTSRYSFIVFALTVSLMTFLFQKNRIRSIKYYLPLVIVFVLIYFLSYQNQFNSFTSPQYTQSFMFKNMSGTNIVDMIEVNLLSNKGIYLTLASGFGIILLLFSNIIKEQKLILVSLIFITYSALMCALSFLGVHPWYVHLRWNMALLIMNVTGLFILISYFFNKIRYRKNNLGNYFSLIILITLIISIKAYYRYVKSVGHYFRIAPDSISANYNALKLKDDSIFYVSKWAMPTWKYLNEYGSLINEYYPDNTVFGDDDVDPPYEYDYVVMSGNGGVSLSSEELETKHKIISVYEPNKIYQIINK